MLIHSHMLKQTPFAQTQLQPDRDVCCLHQVLLIGPAAYWFIKKLLSDSCPMSVSIISFIGSDRRLKENVTQCGVWSVFTQPAEFGGVAEMFSSSLGFLDSGCSSVEWKPATEKTHHQAFNAIALSIKAYSIQPYMMEFMFTPSLS